MDYKIFNFFKINNHKLKFIKNNLSCNNNYNNNYNNHVERCSNNYNYVNYEIIYNNSIFFKKFYKKNKSIFLKKIYNKSKFYNCLYF